MSLSPSGWWFSARTRCLVSSPCAILCPQQLSALENGRHSATVHQVRGFHRSGACSDPANGLIPTKRALLMKFLPRETVGAEESHIHRPVPKEALSFDRIFNRPRGEPKPSGALGRRASASSFQPWPERTALCGLPPTASQLTAHSYASGQEQCARQTNATPHPRNSPGGS